MALKAREASAASLVPAAPLGRGVPEVTPERKGAPAPRALVALEVFVASQALRVTKELQATSGSLVTSAPKVAIPLSHHDFCYANSVAKVPAVSLDHLA